MGEERVENGPACLKRHLLGPTPDVDVFGKRGLQSRGRWGEHPAPPECSDAFKLLMMMWNMDHGSVVTLHLCDCWREGRGATGARVPEFSEKFLRNFLLPRELVR